MQTFRNGEGESAERVREKRKITLVLQVCPSPPGPRIWRGPCCPNFGRHVGGLGKAAGARITHILGVSGKRSEMNRLADGYDSE